MPTMIFEAVLGNMVVATALALFAAGVGRRVNCPALIHTLWLFVLIKLITPPLITFSIPCLPASTQARAVGVAMDSSEGVASFDPTVATMAAIAPNPGLSGRPLELVPSLDSVEAQPRVDQSTSIARWQPSWKLAVAIAWWFGIVFSIGLSIARIRRFAMLLAYSRPASAPLEKEVTELCAKIGLRSVPRVRVVPGGIAPLIWGTFRPSLYLPSDLLARLTTEQKQAIIAHELAHLRRRDHLVRAIEAVVLSIYWWLPLAWLARRELRRFEEEACDSEVAQNAESGFAYASAILETIDYLAGVAPTPSFASGIGDSTALKRRFSRILEAQRHEQLNRRIHLAFVGFGLLCLLFTPRLAPLEAAMEVISLVEMGDFAKDGDQGQITEGMEVGESVQFHHRAEPLLEAGKTVGSAAALAPDGEHLVIATDEKALIWNLRTRQIETCLIGHSDAINAIVYSADGRRVATVGNDSTAIIWNAETGQRLHLLQGSTRSLFAVAFSPDGQTLATAGYDKSIQLWDVETGAIKHIWNGHRAGVRSVAFSPDGKWVATGSADGEIRIWNTREGKPRTLKKHTAAVGVLAFSPDGSLMASGSEDRTVRLWNALDGRELADISMPDFVTALHFSPGGRALFAGSLRGDIVHIDASRAQLRSYLGIKPGQSGSNQLNGEAVLAIRLNSHGSLVAASRDGAVLGWPATGLLQLPQLIYRGSQTMTALALSPDGRILATGGRDGAIHIWDAATAREAKTLAGHPGGVTDLKFGSSNQLVSAGVDERVRVWDVAAGETSHTVIQPTAELTIAISPDGNLLAIGGRKISGIILVKLDAKRKPVRIGEFAGEVTALTFTPSGRHLASGSGSGILHLWDVMSGEESMRGTIGTGSVDGIAFNSTGSTVAAVVNANPRGDDDSQPIYEVVLLDARDGSQLVESKSLTHPGPITAAAFTADNLILTAARDGNLYLWDPRDARVIRLIRGHMESISGIALDTEKINIYSTGGREAKKWMLSGSQ